MHSKTLVHERPNFGGYVQCEFKEHTGQGDKLKRIGIWVRVSTDEAAMGEGPAIHEYRARLFARERKWHVITVYHLEGVSGKSVMNHPETRRMLEDVRSGRITGLVFSKLARLARNTKELLEFAEIFESSKADLISLQEAIDTSTNGGRLFYTVFAAVAQWEREEIADRIKASVPIRAKLGKPINGKATFGYHWVERRLLPDPDTAPIRKLLYYLLIETRRLRTVAKTLNNRGYRTATGALFNFRTVRRLIQEPTPAGSHRANYTTMVDKKVRLKPSSEWVVTSVPPIISRAVWEQCQALLDERRLGRRPGRMVTHLFSGLLWCACGQRMYVPSNTPKYVCLKCRSKVPVAQMELLFLKQAAQQSLNWMEIQSVLCLPTLDDVREQRRVVDVEVANVRRRLLSLQQLWAGSYMSQKAFTARNQKLGLRLIQLTAECARLDEIIAAALERSTFSAARNLQPVAFRKLWSELSFGAKRNVVEHLVDKITVNGATATFSFARRPAITPGASRPIADVL